MGAISERRLCESTLAGSRVAHVPKRTVSRTAPGAVFETCFAKGAGPGLADVGQDQVHASGVDASSSADMMLPMSAGVHSGLQVSRNIETGPAPGIIASVRMTCPVFGLPRVGLGGRAGLESESRANATLMKLSPRRSAKGWLDPGPCNARTAYFLPLGTCAGCLRCSRRRCLDFFTGGGCQDQRCWWSRNAKRRPNSIPAQHPMSRLLSRGPEFGKDRGVPSQWSPRRAMRLLNRAT